LTFPIDIIPPTVTGPRDGRCPHCRTRLEKQEGDFLFLKNAIIKVDLKTRNAAAKCPQCKRWVEVPLQLAGPEPGGPA
jgi:uncharacterized protein with PIN domain